MLGDGKGRNGKFFSPKPRQADLPALSGGIAYSLAFSAPTCWAGHRYGNLALVCGQIIAFGLAGEGCEADRSAIPAYRDGQFDILSAGGIIASCAERTFSK